MAGDAPPAAQRPSGKARARPRLALGFALAALACCWNPVAAPFGAIVGLGAMIVAGLAVRRAERGRRALAVAALAMATLAVLGSAVAFLRTAGAVSADLPGEPVVKSRTAAELDQVLAGAAERTRARREEAARQLDAATPDGGRTERARPRPGAGKGGDGGAADRPPP